jgi:hypothetical protein
MTENGAKYIEEVMVKDPDTGAMIEIEIWKHPSGGMFGVDSAYLDQVTDYVYDPFGGLKIKINYDDEPID